LKGKKRGDLTDSEIGNRGKKRKKPPVIQEERKSRNETPRGKRQQKEFWIR